MSDESLWNCYCLCSQHHFSPRMLYTHPSTSEIPEPRKIALEVSSAFIREHGCQLWKLSIGSPIVGGRWAWHVASAGRRRTASWVMQGLRIFSWCLQHYVTLLGDKSESQGGSQSQDQKEGTNIDQRAYRARIWGPLGYADAVENKDPGDELRNCKQQHLVSRPSRQRIRRRQGHIGKQSSAGPVASGQAPGELRRPSWVALTTGS